MNPRIACATVCLLLQFSAIPPTHAADALSELTLEDLTSTEVTSVSRKSQSLASVPAAAFVISSDDILRSGALTLPDVLRMAPGIEVAQIDNGRFAVTARGFNGRFANKLQVLIDGHSIYMPTFSGVMWEHEAIALEDIERIEVIRGPGAAVWGVNAVSGVINIISKHSRNASGALVDASAGDHDRKVLYARYGGALDENTTWKISVQGRHADPSTQFVSRSEGNDRQTNGLVDWRLDRNTGGGSDLAIWASAMHTTLGDRMLLDFVPGTPSIIAPLDVIQSDSTETLMVRYRWLTNSGIESSMQAAMTGSTIHIKNYFEEDRDTYDLDYQGRYTIANQDLLWGLSHRTSAARTKSPNPFLSVSPTDSTQVTNGVFAQDDITLVQDRVQLGLGARFDRTNLGGNSTATNATLMWTPTHVDSLWVKFGKAPRMPAQAERTATVLTNIVPAAPPDVPLPILFRSMAGTDALKSERMEGFEVGYRTQIASSFNVDLTGFRYRYRDRVTGAQGSFDMTTLFPVAFIQNVEICNCSNGTISGVELSADWLILPTWRVQLAQSWTRIRMDHTSDAFVQEDGREIEKGTPKYYGSLRSEWNITSSQEIDAWLRGSAGFSRVNAPYTDLVHVPGYVTLDLRYAKKLNRNLEIAATGRNLIGPRRVEFVSDYIPSIPLEVGRSVMLTARRKF